MANILICDDAEFMRKSLRKIVESAGHNVVGEAQDGIFCINLCNQLNPDIILMDITMPDMDGIIATKKIVEKNKNVKIIMVSSMGTYEKVLEAIQCGARDFIVKPFVPQKVIECIAKYTL